MAAAFDLGRLVRALSLAVVVVSLTLALAGCGAPDTPDNAVMDYLTAQQMGKSGADRHLCDELRAQLKVGAGDRVAGYRTVVDDALGVFGDGPTTTTGDTATVPLVVQMTPSRDSRNGEKWTATVVKENGTWRLCGFTRA